MTEDEQIRQYKDQLVQFLVEGQKELASDSKPKQWFEVKRLALTNLDSLRILDEIRKLEQWLQERS